MTAKLIKIVRDLFIIGGARIWLLYGVILFVVVAPAASIRINNYNRLKADLTSSTLTKHQALADTMAEALFNRLQQLDEYTDALANHPQVRDDVVAGKWQAAIDLITINRQFRGDAFDDRVFLANAQGVLQADTPALAGVRGQDFSYRSWFTSVVSTGQTSISPVYQRVAQPQLNVVSVSAPITSTTNQIVGVVVTQIALDHFQNWLRSQDVSPGQVAYMVDQQGQVVAHPDYPPQGQIVTLDSMPAVQRVVSGKSGNLVTGSGQAARLVSYAPVPKFGWGIVLEEPLQKAGATQSQTLHQFLTLEFLGSIWNVTVLLLLLMTIHRLVQYLFAEELQRQAPPATKVVTPTKPRPVKKTQRRTQFNSPDTQK